MPYCWWRQGKHEGDVIVVVFLIQLPLRLLPFRPLRAVDVVGVHALMLLLPLLRTVFPDLTLVHGEALPLLGDRLGEICLPLLLRGAISLLSSRLPFLTTMASEQDEGILRSLDVVFVALLWPVFDVAAR